MRYLLAVALVVVTGCSVFDEAEPDIHPSVKRSVDTMAADRDCFGLQAAFDRHDDREVLGYIDDALDDAGCYG